RRGRTSREDRSRPCPGSAPRPGKAVGGDDRGGPASRRRHLRAVRPSLTSSSSDAKPPGAPRPSSNVRGMFEHSQAFSGFAVNDTTTAKQFYANTLGLNVTQLDNGFLQLHIDGSREILVYAKPDHTP